MKFPVLLEQANSLGGWASILSLSLVEVRYAAFPPRAFQNSSVSKTSTFQVTIFEPHTSILPSSNLKGFLSIWAVGGLLAFF